MALGLALAAGCGHQLVEPHPDDYLPRGRGMQPGSRHTGPMCLQSSGHRLSETRCASYEPAIASVGGRVTVLWTELGDGADCDSFGNRSIWMRSVETTGVEEEPIVLIEGDGNNGEPSAVWVGEELVVVWERTQADGAAELMFGTFDAEGSSIVQPVALTVPSLVNDPQIVWNPEASEFGLFWSGAFQWSSDEETKLQIFFQRVSVRGEILSDPLELTSTDPSFAHSHVRAVWNGAAYGVTWNEYHPEDESFEDRYDIVFAEVSADGTMAMRHTLASAQGPSRPTVTVTNSASFGVSWAADGIFLAPDGSSADVVYEVGDTASGADRPLHCNVIATPTGYGLTWFSQTDDAFYFAEVDHEGTLIGDIRCLAEDVATSEPPEVLWTGQDFAVAWPGTVDGEMEMFVLTVAAEDLLI